MANTRPILASLALLAGLANPAAAQSTAKERFDAANKPAGYQAGSWAVLPAATLRGGYDDNISSSAAKAVASPFVELRGRVDAVRAADDEEARAYVFIGGVWYTDADDKNKYEGGIGASYRTRVGLWRIRGAVDLGAGTEAITVGDGIENAGIFDPYKDPSQFYRAAASFGIERDVGTLFVGANGSISYASYDDRATEGGIVVNQDFRTGYIAEVNLRAGYRPSDVWAVFVEGGANMQSFENAAADSTGYRAVAGAAFQIAGRLNGEIFAGYQWQSFDRGGIDGFTYGANLKWFVTDFISLTLDARRDIRAEQVAASGSDSIFLKRRDTLSARIDYDPLETLLIYGEARYFQEVCGCLGDAEDGWGATIGAEWAFARNFKLSGAYSYDQGSSVLAGAFERNRFSLGLTAQY